MREINDHVFLDVPRGMKKSFLTRVRPAYMMALCSSKGRK